MIDRIAPDGAQPDDVTLVADGFSFLETPRWRDARLWAIDMYAERVVSVGADGNVATIEIGEVPAGLAWARSGELLVLTRAGSIRRRTPDGWQEVAQVPTGPAPCHEITVDARGNMFVGVFGLASGALLSVDAAGRARRVAGGLLLPNGQALTDDGRTLLVAESAGQRITAFTIEPDGSLVDRRVWASLGPPATARTLPQVFGQVETWCDGIAVDPDGGCWVADAFGRRALRFDRSGRMTDEIGTGGFGCYSCAFGGDDGSTLYLCTAPPGEDEAARRTGRQGRLLARHCSVGSAG